MTLSLVAVGAKVTAAIVNNIIGVVNAGGLQLVVPTGVSGTGVTVTTLGKVAFTGATTVSVDGAFAGPFDNFAVVVNVSSASAADDLAMRLRLAGTDQSAANYSDARATVNPGSSAFAVITESAQTRLLLGRIDTGGTSLKADVFTPNQPRPVRTLATGFDASKYATQYWGALADTTAYDGFTIYGPGGGTITGTLRVYGYNNG